MGIIPFRDGAYATGSNRATLLGRLFPSLVYYTRMGPIVWRSSRKAKKGLYDRLAWEKGSHEIIEALESVGIDFHVTGVQNIAAVQGPCVFIGNHMSTLETLALPAMILPFKRTTFVVKKSLVEYPVFKHIMTSCNPVVVGRTNPRDDFKVVIEEGGKRLQDGISVIVFPQTTRTPAFDPTQFNTIGVKLAKRANVPVIPLALKTDAWTNGKVIKDFGRIDPARKVCFAFGEPMEIRDKGREEQALLVSFIERHLGEWQHEWGAPTA